jgi:hypothetical protein
VVEPTARPPLQHAQTVGIPHQPQQRRKLTAGVISLSGEADAPREWTAGVSELGRDHAIPQRGSESATSTLPLAMLLPQGICHEY